MMKNGPTSVYILTDLEGVAGVEDWDPVAYGRPNGRALKKEMVDLLAKEVNAAVEGALTAGATEILVRDGHGSADNLDLSNLHPSVRLIRGKASGEWLPGLDSSVDALVFVGQHAREGAPGGILAHSWSGTRPRKYYLDDREIGEIGAAVYLARWHGVPTRFLAGDQAAVDELLAIEPDAVTVATKRQDAHGPVHLPSEECRALIAEGVADALHERSHVRTQKPVPPFKLVETFARPPWGGIPFVAGRILGEAAQAKLLQRLGRSSPKRGVRSRILGPRSIEHVGDDLPDVLACGIGFGN